MTSRRLFTTFLAACIFLPATALASSPEKKKGGGVRYTQFPMMTVSTGSGVRHGTMSVEVGLYAADDKMSQDIKLYVPRLQDAYITALQAYAVNLNSRSLTDTDFMANQLQAATDRVLGRKGAKVLLGSVMLN